jgi:hypothetical protein
MVGRDCSSDKWLTWKKQSIWSADKRDKKQTATQTYTTYEEKFNFSRILAEELPLIGS